MDIWDIDKIMLFLTFVIPGFVSIKVYQIIFPGTERSSSDLLIDAISYSCITYAILGVPIYLVESGKLREQSGFLYFLFYVFVFFVFPIILVSLWKAIRTSDFMQRRAPHPTDLPWDYVFSQGQHYWVKVTLNDGRAIYGKYSERSFSSSAPAKEQIYLEEAWFADKRGGFKKRKKKSAGVIIVSSEISTVEFWHLN